MYLLSIYKLGIANKDIYCSHADEWLVYPPVLSFSTEHDSSANKVCKLNLKFGFESFIDTLAEYDLHSKHISIKKYVRKVDENGRFVEEFVRPVIIEINKAEDIPLGVFLDFMIYQEICNTRHEHSCSFKYFKKLLAWDIQISGRFEEVLNNLRNLLWEQPKDNLYNIAIQFIIELKMLESNNSTSIISKTISTGMFSFVVEEDNIVLSRVDERDFYSFEFEP